jgi:hypothetical protein
MRSLWRGVVLWTVLAVLGGSPAGADTQMILGRKLDVRNPSDADPTRRSVFINGREGPDSTDPLVGDPTINGATVRVVVRGDAAVYDETFELPASGWSVRFTRHDWPVYKTFTYSNLEVGGPVRSVVVTRSGYASREGTPPPDQPRPGHFRIRVRLRGTDGPVNILPPNPGTDGGIVLTLGGGDSLCVGFGSSAGGEIVSNTERRFAIMRPASEACPGQ